MQSKENTTKCIKPIPSTITVIEEKHISPIFDPQEVKVLSEAEQDDYGIKDLPSSNSKYSMILDINKDHPLKLIPDQDIRDRGKVSSICRISSKEYTHDLGQILGMTLSPDGTLLVTFSNTGTALVWDVDTMKLVQSLRDDKVSETL